MTQVHILSLPPSIVLYPIQIHILLLLLYYTTPTTIYTPLRFVFYKVLLHYYSTPTTIYIPLRFTFYYYYILTIILLLPSIPHSDPRFITTSLLYYTPTTIYTPLRFTFYYYYILITTYFINILLLPPSIPHSDSRFITTITILYYYYTTNTHPIQPMVLTPYTIYNGTPTQRQLDGTSFIQHSIQWNTNWMVLSSYNIVYNGIPTRWY